MAQPNTSRKLPRPANSSSARFRLVHTNCSFRQWRRAVTAFGPGRVMFKPTEPFLLPWTHRFPRGRQGVGTATDVRGLFASAGERLGAAVRLYPYEAGTVHITS